MTSPFRDSFYWSNQAIDAAARLMCDGWPIRGGQCSGPACPCWPGRRRYAGKVLEAALWAEREAVRRAVEDVVAERAWRE